MAHPQLSLAAAAGTVLTLLATSGAGAFCRGARSPAPKQGNSLSAAAVAHADALGPRAAAWERLNVLPTTRGVSWTLSAICAAGAACLAAGPARRPSLRATGAQRAPCAVRLSALAGMRIIGTGSCAPETVVSNTDLSEIVETNDEWIVQRTGIRSRHVLKPDETLSSICLVAARRALEKAGLPAEKLGLVLLATSTPDDLFGSATAVAAGLGATNAVAFDLTAACSGFVFALVTASQYIRSGTVTSAVVIGADCLSRWVDWSDRTTCVLFGDGAGAVVLEAAPPGQDALIGFEMGSDGNGRCHLACAASSKAVSLGGGKEGANGAFKFLGMNGAEVFRFATSKVPKVLASLLEKHGVKPEDVDWLLLHQANRRIMDSAAKKLDLPLEKVLCNLDEYGNTSAGSIPLALDEAVRDGRVRPGQLIACMGFGAGLSWGGCLLRM